MKRFLAALFVLLLVPACDSGSGADKPTRLPAGIANVTQAATPTSKAAATSVPPAATATAVPPAATTAPSTTISVSSPVGRGNMATATAHTLPGANCTIGYTTPSGSASTAGGLVAKTADGGGNVSWMWLIGASTAPGTGSVRVTCGGASATAAIVITA